MLIDLSHTLTPSIPVYPGDIAPVFEDVSMFETHGYRERRLHFSSHAGTHMDAPAHLLEGGRSLDQMELDCFAGKGLVLDVRGLSVIDRVTLETHEALIETCDFVLFYAGFSEFWGSHRYFERFPCLNREAASYLAQFKLKGVGVDTFSVDPLDSVDCENHKILLGKERVIIENLAGLEQLLGKSFQLLCFPLKLETADGSPIRAVALLNCDK